MRIEPMMYVWEWDGWYVLAASRKDAMEILTEARCDDPAMDELHEGCWTLDEVGDIETLRRLPDEERLELHTWEVSLPCSGHFPDLPDDSEFDLKVSAEAHVWAKLGRGVLAVLS